MPQPQATNFDWNDWVHNNLLTRAGDYWAADNARFEATNPSFLARVDRAFNPMTSFGSAMGQMQTAAGSGDALGMVVATLGSLPIGGGIRSAQEARALMDSAAAWQRVAGQALGPGARAQQAARGLAEMASKDRVAAGVAAAKAAGSTALDTSNVWNWP